MKLNFDLDLRLILRRGNILWELCNQCTHLSWCWCWLMQGWHHGEAPILVVNQCTHLSWCWCWLMRSRQAVVWTRSEKSWSEKQKIFNVIVGHLTTRNQALLPRRTFLQHNRDPQLRTYHQYPYVFTLLASSLLTLSGVSAVLHVILFLE